MTWILQHLLKKATLELTWTGNDEKELHIKLLWNDAILVDRYIDIVR